MGQKIDRDYERFRKIVRGKVKSNLGKYISRGEMIGQKGKDLISIPLPQIDIPQFRYGNKGQGGVGQGKGDVGTPVGPPQPGDGSEGAGSEPGDMTRACQSARPLASSSRQRSPPAPRSNTRTSGRQSSSSRNTGPRIRVTKGP